MNELQLSDDLPIIESELKAFKEMNGYSIYEIGRRLKHVKENDLVHGQWTEWLEKVDVHPREAQRFIKIVSDPQLKTTTWSHLGSRALYEITGVPVEEREKKHITEKGEEKSVDEMTIKEIQDLKRQLKQSDEEKSHLESQLEQAQRSESIALKQLEDAEDREPEVKREVKEVIPPHVKAQLSDRQRMIEAKDKEIEQLQEQMSNAEEQKQKFEKQEYLEDEEQIASMNFQVESTVLEIKDNINRFLNENSANAFKEAAIARASERTKNQIYDGIEELEAFCRTMRRSLDSNVIIGG